MGTAFRFPKMKRALCMMEDVLFFFFLFKIFIGV